jgi:glycosyltransferase involved in cell wall biosynthesis
VSDRTTPLVSVVVPTRERWPLLARRALPSALEQEAVEVQVVVVDDASTDETPRRLAELEEPRVTVVRRERSGGMAAARNSGIEAARGTWIAFLDDDDVWAPRKLARQLAAAREAGADWAYAGALAVDPSGVVLDELYLPPPERLGAELLHACVLPAGASNVVVRADALRSLGGFDESFVHVSDWDLWLRLIEAGPPAVVDDPLVAYLLHPTNMHVVDDPSAELDALVRKHAAAVPPRAIRPDRAGYDRWVAGQRSRAGRHLEAARVYARAAVRHRSPGNLARAADALLGKRLSRGTRLLRRSADPADRRKPAPEWLARYSA